MMVFSLQVDNVKTYLPMTVDEGLAQVYQSGINIVVETNFGLKLTYDTISMAKIEIPSTFKNAVKGLCGNYNGNSADDFILPGGIQAPSVVDFAEAWVSPSDKMMCQTSCGSKCLNPDKDKQKEAETALQYTDLREGAIFWLLRKNSTSDILWWMCQRWSSTTKWQDSSLSPHTKVCCQLSRDWDVNQHLEE